MSCCKKPVQVKVKRLDPNAKLPTLGSTGSAGWDLYALEDVKLAATDTTNAGYQDSHYCSKELGLHSHAVYCWRSSIRTGIAVEIPQGYEGQIRPRSGLAFKEGITVLNSPGTIDHDYRGEIKVLLVNFGHRDVVIFSGERIAQLCIRPVPAVELLEVDELSITARGTGGFGSTGK